MKISPIQSLTLAGLLLTTGATAHADSSKTLAAPAVATASAEAAANGYGPQGAPQTMTYPNDGQPYYGDNDRYDDRDTVHPAVIGGILGGAGGAIAGNFIKAGGSRLAGGLIGGGLGALAGVAIGELIGHHHHHSRHMPISTSQPLDYNYGPVDDSLSYHGQWVGTMTGSWNGGPTTTWRGSYNDHDGRPNFRGRFVGGQSGYEPHVWNDGYRPMYRQRHFEGAPEFSEMWVQSQPIITRTVTTHSYYVDVPIRTHTYYVTKHVWHPRPIHHHCNKPVSCPIQGS